MQICMNKYKYIDDSNSFNSSKQIDVYYNKKL